MSPTKDDGWQEWSKYVLTELERNHEDHKSIMKALNAIQVELGMLKVKAGLWGALAGAVPAIIAVLWVLFKGAP